MKTRVATAGLAAFLLLDVALVSLAMRPSADVATPPVVTSSAPPTQASTATATPTATVTSSAYTPGPLTVLIVGIDATRAWRARAGSCAAGGALVQTTSNAGASWTKGSRPGPVIARIQPLGGGSGFVYAADAQCVLAEHVTGDNAFTWSGGSQLSGAWTRSPKDTNVVVTPQVAASRPCGDEAVLDLARYSGTQAQVLCRDGGVKQTRDSGSTWTDAGTAQGALALASRDESGVSAIYVARVAKGCAGIEIAQLLSGGADPRRVGCVPTTASAAAGQIALSIPATGGWLAIGAETWVAGPDLASWTKA